MNLVIVESPAKAKTIKKYLGKKFEVMASYGHVRDLPPKQGAIMPDRDFKGESFEPHYEILEKNAKHVDAISKAMAKAQALYLATDPDREGEAISWHVYEILKERNTLESKPVHRIVFNQITQTAVNEALNNPREISMDLVNAQQARRALDYLVGFNLSPLLWKKVRRGLSAGRVQSPALRMIVEREEEIENFKSQEYWTILAEVEKQDLPFTARLSHYKNEKLEQFTIPQSEQAESIKKDLLKVAKGQLIVDKVEKKQRKRNPAPPFITSTLQQEAARKLGFTAQRTMRIAQQLYEGIDIGDGAHGLITYMRTDSLNLAQEAIAEIRATIGEHFGETYLPEQPRFFKSKVKNAQEAHEAIRPTSASSLPDRIKTFLSSEQFKLYELIWKRTVACQMAHALLDTVSVDLSCKNAIFRASGSTIVEPGFLVAYQEDEDDIQKSEENKLPPLKEGDIIKLIDIITQQHFTEPPPRFTEASLIKALEERGIGRPSTYASIISTLQQRDYVVLDQKRFHPTDIGRIVNKFLTNYFSQYVDYDFTAHMEDELDNISRGEKEWVPMLRDFWQPFNHLIHDVEEHVQRKDVVQEQLDEACPKCGKPLTIRLAKRANFRFIGCTGYPDCDYTRELNQGEKQAPEVEEIEGRKCPECGGNLQIKHGRYGKFIGCGNYPKCKHIEPLQKPFDTGIECPECKQGTLLKRKSRRNKIFYSCSRYPECQYAIWNEPIDEPCPKCGWPILTIKTTKRRGTEKVCARKTCDFAAPYELTNEEKS